MPAPQSLLVPGHYADSVSVEHDVDIAKAFDTHLQAIDAALRCMWVKPDAPGFDPSGRWYVMYQHANPELNQYWSIQTPEGEYCEPQERHLEAVLRMDAWQGQQSYATIEKARDARQKVKDKRKDETRREFREKLLDRLSHDLDGRISVPRALPFPTPHELVDKKRELILP